MNLHAIRTSFIVCILTINSVFIGFQPPFANGQELETQQKLNSSPLNSQERTKTAAEKFSEDIRDSNSLFQAQDLKVIVQFRSEPSAEALRILSQSEANALKRFSKLDIFSAKLPPYALAQLANLDEVEYISPERNVELFGHISATTGVDNILAQNTTVYDGSNIGIAILDSGIYDSHKSLRDNNGNRSVVFSRDFTGEAIIDDVFGHGTHVAALAGGSDQVARGAYRGVAPKANILNLRVLGSNGTGRLTDLLSALDWILANRAAQNIRVVNLSLGMPAVDSYLDDPLCRAARRLVDAGIVVVAAAGNNGKDAQGRKAYGLIHSPGNEPSVITVGASNTFGTDSRTDDGVATYSSRGPTRSYSVDTSGVKHFDNIIKPDLVAPGNKIISANAERNRLVASNPQLDAHVSISGSRNMMFLNGTSMASPIVAGAAALLLQANPNLTPNMVKAILQFTAQPLAGFNEFDQGAGEVNIDGAIRLAKLVRRDLPNNPTLGTRLLTTTALPVPTTTIVGSTFSWAQGINLGRAFVRGSDLFLKYQKIYGLGVIVADGVLVTPDGVIVADTEMVSDGVIVADQIQISGGGTLGSGTFYLSVNALRSGTLILPGGVIVCDGVIVADVNYLNSLLIQAANARVFGDNTSQMPTILHDN
jgi:serine protease AprX